MFCNCPGTVPAFPSSGCNTETRTGGIKRVIFAACDLVFTDITDTAEWTTHITADKVHATGEVKGSKPKASFTKKKLFSCHPEEVTGATRQIQIQDPNADNTNFADYTFWNTIQAEHRNFLVGYTDCDDIFYGWIPDFTIELDDVRDDDVEGATVFDVTIAWSSLTMTVPQSIPGLNAVLA